MIVHHTRDLACLTVVCLLGLLITSSCSKEKSPYADLLVGSWKSVKQEFYKNNELKEETLTDEIEITLDGSYMTGNTFLGRVRYEVKGDRFIEGNTESIIRKVDETDLVIESVYNNSPDIFRVILYYKRE